MDVGVGGPFVSVVVVEAVPVQGVMGGGDNGVIGDSGHGSLGL